MAGRIVHNPIFHPVPELQYGDINMFRALLALVHRKFGADFQLRATKRRGFLHPFHTHSFILFPAVGRCGAIIA